MVWLTNSLYILKTLDFPSYSHQITFTTSVPTEITRHDITGDLAIVFISTV